MEKFRPSIVVKGREYENINNEELDIIKKFNGKLIFSSGEVTFTSQDLIEKEIQINKSLNFPKNYLLNHKINLKDLKKILNKFKKLNVAIIGDLIIDHYLYCQPLGMSQEDNSLVVKESAEKSFIGGAGIVALHAAGMGSKIDFFTVADDDEGYKFAKKIKFKKFKVVYFKDRQRPTTIKKRYKYDDKTMFRSSKLYQNSISRELENKFMKLFLKKIKYDLIVFSDFNYGFVTQNIVDRVRDLAKKNKILIVDDIQSSSQDGNICRFKRMNLITPTEREARLACRNNEDGLIVLADKLREECMAENIIIKLGQLGLIIDIINKRNGIKETDKIGVLNNYPKDVVGTGIIY